MIRSLLYLGLALILSDILGLGHWLLPKAPWVQWIPLAGFVVLPVVVLFLLRKGITAAASHLERSFDRFTLVAIVAWLLAYFWGIFMAFPEPQRWGIWLAMVVLVWRMLELLRQKTVEAASHARLAAESRGLALRTRLAPHFLFNVLAAMKAQLRRDPESAEATLDNLAALFRQLVEVADLPRIPLRRELEFIEAYLSLEQVRLGPRLRVRFEIPEELEDRPIPPLSLQVLVENAVKHGVSPLEQGGEVRISARAVGGGLRLQVEDPGPGFARSAAVPTGTGTALDTLRQRLSGAGELTFERGSDRHTASLFLAT